MAQKAKKKSKLRHAEYYDMQKTFDSLYADSKSGEVFGHLMDIISAPSNIKLAFRNIKGNDGSHTAGTDGRTIESLAVMPEDKFVKLIQKQFRRYEPKAVKRVEIPKPNGKMRPLGIPCIIDRIVQQCILQVMEPICEAKFYEHSYGFRPCRSAENAISYAYGLAQTKTVRVGESLGLVVTSGYCNCPICCGQWSGGPTASGAMPTANHTIAVDAANPFVPIGTHVVMNGVEYVVEDTGAFARYGVQFDVYYDNHAAASAHGHQTWEAYIADSNGNQEVQVTTTKEVNRLDVTMTNHSLDAVLRSRMTEEEQERYDAYNKYYGNRDYLFDLNSIPTGSSGFGYDIPADALSDPQFAKMIQEAEKYLGVPYVWGGYSPSGFDCSGFVSWVINNCGNGWNVGRCTADELRSHCSQVSPSEAKPGDLIFFQGTYDTPGASHVGIYVGNNMMIHCGKPVQYTSIASAYWQEHFMAFGRLH